MSLGARGQLCAVLQQREPSCSVFALPKGGQKALSDALGSFFGVSALSSGQSSPPCLFALSTRFTAWRFGTLRGDVAQHRRWHGEGRRTPTPLWEGLCAQNVCVVCSVTPWFGCHCGPTGGMRPAAGGDPATCPSSWHPVPGQPSLPRPGGALPKVETRSEEIQG